MSRSRALYIFIFIVSLAASGAASDGTAVAGGYTLGTGRTVPTVAAVVGLIGVIAGVVTLVRPASLRSGALISLVLGLISGAVGGVHAAYAAGGVGTGNGLAGAVVAIALGSLGLLLGALAYFRSQRSAPRET